MKRLSLSLTILAMVLAGAARAADHNPKSKLSTLPATVSSGDTATTSEMRPYQPYQQQTMDPQTMVRQRAEARAMERERRIESLQWYGFSNQRPRASGDPYNTDYAPLWASGNPSPYRWCPTGNTVVVLPRDTYTR